MKGNSMNLRDGCVSGKPASRGSIRYICSLFWLTAVLLTVCIVGHTPLKGLGDWKNNAVLFERVLPLPVLRIPEFLLGVVLGLRFLRQKIFQEQPRRP